MVRRTLGCIGRLRLLAVTAVLALAPVAPAVAADRGAPVEPAAPAATLTVVHTRTVTHTVRSLTTGSGTVYGGTDQGIVAIDPSTGRVVRQVARVGAFGVQDVALDPTSGDVFAVAVSDSRLYRIDPATGQVVRSAPQSTLLGYVAVDPVRHRVVATTDTGVVAFDSRTLRAIWSVEFDGFPDDVAVDSTDGKTLVPTTDDGLIVVTASGRLDPNGIFTDYTALRVATDPARDTIYVGSYGRVVVVVHGTAVRSVTVRGDVEDLAVDPATGRAYATSDVNGAIGHGWLTELDGTHARRLADLRLAGGAVVVGRSATHTVVGAYPSWGTPARLYTVNG